MTILADHVGLAQIVQENTLARYIGEALFPALLYRAGVVREPWEAAAGQTMTFTVPGLYAPDTTSRTPGVTPAYKTFEYEHYKATANKKGWPITVDMPSNYVTATPQFWQSMKNLGLGAAQTMNRMIRNPLYTAYQAGHAIVDAVAGGGVSVTVSSLNGFTEVPDGTNAFPVPVSSTNPRQVLVNGVLLAQTIIGATPNDPLNPNGPGVLTFSAANTIVAGDRLDTLDASRIIRPGNVTTVDGITAGDGLTMRLINRAVADLRRDNVGPCSDGFYHVHLDPLGEYDIFQDNAFQRQIQNRGLEDEPYLTFSTGRTAACTFFSNNETPQQGTVTAGTFVQSRPATAPLAFMSGDIGAELTNATGVTIGRTIVMGGGTIFEKYVNESAYMSEAGVSGKIGGMQVVNNGVEIPMDGIRVILKAPTDVFNEVITAAWSWTGDFVPPTNRLTGLSSAAYKRARIIEHAVEA